MGACYSGPSAPPPNPLSSNFPSSPLGLPQYISQKVISPPQQSQDPSQQSAQAILKFLPIMIGELAPGRPSPPPRPSPDDWQSRRSHL